MAPPKKADGKATKVKGAPVEQLKDQAAAATPTPDDPTHSDQENTAGGRDNLKRHASGRELGPAPELQLNDQYLDQEMMTKGVSDPNDQLDRRRLLLVTGNTLRRGSATVWSLTRKKKDEILGVLGDLLYKHPGKSVSHPSPAFTLVTSLPPRYDEDRGQVPQSRQDLNITLKLFLLQDPNPAHVQECLRMLEQFGPDPKHLAEQNTDSGYLADSVILSWKGVGLVSKSEDDEDLAGMRRQVEGILPAYGELENAVQSGKIASIGVSELSVGELEILLPNVKIKPTSNHINLNDCCIVPKDLMDYAKAQDIELLTHSDTSESHLDEDKLNFLVEKSEEVGSGWQPRWVLRYGVMVRSTGVVKDKGYMVMAEGTRSNTGPKASEMHDQAQPQAVAT